MFHSLLTFLRKREKDIISSHSYFFLGGGGGGEEERRRTRIIQQQEKVLVEIGIMSGGVQERKKHELSEKKVSWDMWVPRVVFET